MFCFSCSFSPPHSNRAVRQLASGGSLVLLRVMTKQALVDVGNLMVNDASITKAIGGSAYIEEVVGILPGTKVQVDPQIAGTAHLEAVGNVLTLGGCVGISGAQNHVRP